MSDSYTSACVEPYIGYSISDDPCESVGYEQRSEYLGASLYGFKFRLQVAQGLYGTGLLLEDESLNVAAVSLKISYDFDTKRATLNSGTGGSDVNPPFAPAPVVTELTNFPSGRRTYAQVWQITNPLNAAQGRATAVTVYYIDRDYGLIRFEQRDGTAWTLEP